MPSWPNQLAKSIKEKEEFSPRFRSQEFSHDYVPLLAQTPDDSFQPLLVQTRL
jgi:hypothetical protein